MQTLSRAFVRTLRIVAPLSTAAGVLVAVKMAGGRTDPLGIVFYSGVFGFLIGSFVGGASCGGAYIGWRVSGRRLTWPPALGAGLGSLAAWGILALWSSALISGGSQASEVALVVVSAVGVTALMLVGPHLFGRRRAEQETDQ